MLQGTNPQGRTKQKRNERFWEETTGRRRFLSTLAGIGTALSMPLGAADATSEQITDGPIESSYTLTSPDGSVILHIELEDGSLYYSLDFDRHTLIDESDLGIELTDGSLDGNLVMTGSRTVSQDETWEPIWGGFSEIRNHYNQLEIGLETTDSPTRALSLEFRAFDDGIGFRYIFPAQENLDDFTITSENTGFEFAGDYESWWIPNDWDNYEYYYSNTPISEIDAGEQQNHNKTGDPLPINEGAAAIDGVNTPLTMKAAEDCYLSIHEAALTDYSGMTLTQAKQGTTSFKSSLVPNPDGSKVQATVPHASPWRTVQLGRSPGDLVESRLILNLNEPSRIDDPSWIEPQKYCGVWWELHIGKSKWPNGEDDGVPIGATTSNVKRYMEFASEHGIGTVLAEGWNKAYDSDMIYTDSGDHFDYRDVWDYGQSLDPPVEFMAHNETVGHIDRYERQMDEAYSWYGDNPVNSVKSGYVGEENVSLDDEVHHHHDQAMVQHYRRSITAAAENELMLNAHEPIKPTGVRRTYPNFMTREGAAGLEYHNFTTDGVPPSHTVTTPFTRMLAGPIDHCPGIFDVFYDEYTGGLQASPDCRVHTTRTRQLAYYPMILSGLEMVADLPEHYGTSDKGNQADTPEEFKYIQDVPVDWDETRVPTAEIGSYAAIARRSGDEWWVGIATDEQARTVDVPLDFLQGGLYVVTIYADATDTDLEESPMEVRKDEILINANDTLFTSMVAGGGQALRIQHISDANQEWRDGTQQDENRKQASLATTLPFYSRPEQSYTSVSIPETVTVGDRFITITGTNAGTVMGGEWFDVYVDGKKKDEELVRLPPEGGSYLFSTSIDERGTHEVSIGPSTGKILATRTVTFESDLPLGKQLARWNDPDGDDHGPGSYVYPQHAWFNEGAFDIATFEVWETDTRYQFLYTIHGELHNPRGWSRGFSVQLPELYLRDPDATGIPQSTESRQGVHADLAVPYHYRFENIEGTDSVQPQLVDGNGRMLTEDVNVTASSVVDAIMFDVSKDVIGSVQNMEFCPVMLGEDDSVDDRTRGVVSTETWKNGWQRDWRFGGGRDDEMDSNVIDIVLPEGTSQSEALDYTESDRAEMPFIEFASGAINRR